MGIFRFDSHSTNSDEKYIRPSAACTSYLTCKHNEVGKTAERACGKFRYLRWSNRFLCLFFALDQLLWLYKLVLKKLLYAFWRPEL